eukprot:2256774-Pyramimonas_sp.AAC.1
MQAQSVILPSFAASLYLSSLSCVKAIWLRPDTCSDERVCPVALAAGFGTCTWVLRQIGLFTHRGPVVGTA